jgi:hypothetical protein
MKRVPSEFFLWILFFAFGMILSESAAFCEDIAYNSHGKRDPFVPLVTLTTREASGLLGVESVDEILVEGIVYDPKKGSVVIVNGTVLKEKEELGNVKVMEIKPNGATFSVNGVEGFKPLYQEETRKDLSGK